MGVISHYKQDSQHILSKVSKLMAKSSYAFTQLSSQFAPTK